MTLATSGITPVTEDYNVKMATGTFTGDGSAAANINIGFTPKYFKLFDISDVFSWEWVQGMAATNTWYTTGAADPAVDTNSVIKTNGQITQQVGVGVYDPNQGGANDGVLINTTVNVFGPNLALPFLTLSTNALVNAKAYVWVAFG